MKVLIIGGSGFLGSYVADELSKKKHSITILDKKKSEYLNRNQKQVILDTKNLHKNKNILNGIDVVYFFSGMSDLNDCKHKPIETVNENILPLVNILELCVKRNIKRFIFASTVYVNSSEGNFYKSSKIASESYIKEFSKNYGLKYTILRYGSIYGQRSDEKNGMYRIIKNALTKKKLIYKGSKNSVREYIHVQDAAKASVDILNKKFLNKTIVLTGQDTIKVSELLYTINEIMNKKLKVSFSEKKFDGHYIRSPYSFDDEVGKKYKRSTYIDIGQGLIQLIKFVKNKINKK